MSSMQRAVESSNAAATKINGEVLNVKGRLTSVLSGKGVVAERMREQSRQQAGKLFEDLAAGPESLLEAQAFVDRRQSRASVDLEHKRISEQLRSLYSETHDLEEERATLLAEHYALGRQASVIES